MIFHPIKPIYNNDSKILILGSFPSAKSREENFYYANPYNRFWKLIAIMFNVEFSNSIEEKIDFLLRNKIALWDVISSCDINGSSDSSIKNVRPNDIEMIINSSDIKLIVLNGRTSEKYFNMFFKNAFKIDTVCLPSTSPANARESIESLLPLWSIIKKYI
jgi:hypoxanthine-DNA glycosylase